MTTPFASHSTIEHLVADGVTKPLPLYTHATVHNGTVYVSCLQGFIPGTLDFPSEDAADQARQALSNLKVVLEQAGSSMERALKITLLMTDMADFPRINEAINEAFPVDPPARGSIAVTELPKQAKIVIDAIAALGT
jgi:2-iminobutanoate/2-iminopropanoate deaminase